MAQSPHPPILIGGHGPRVIERVIAYGDGWLPMLVEPTPTSPPGSATCATGPGATSR
jgi:alkanesulfonate monooxygenase SsuD/methylene tetrahydromethanopterin reductase-like flavin-dependent oxidoreductase (luciferase family)